MKDGRASPERPALPCRRGRFLPRRFVLASVLSLPRHGDSGEDRWATAENAWSLCDGASEGYDGAGWAAALARALVLHGDPREAVSAARRLYRAGLGAYAVQPNSDPARPRGGVYAVQPNPPSPPIPPRGAAYAVQPNSDPARPRGGVYAVQPNPGTSPAPGAPPPSAAAWLAEASVARGSFSTALVVRVSRAGGFVRAYARGDSALFVRDGLETLAAFPMDRAEDFNLTPDLISASGDGTDDFLAATIPIGALRRPVLCLATDALAARILGAAARERAELWDFLDRADAADLDEWARAEIASRSLREDDLTLLSVRP